MASGATDAKLEMSLDDLIHSGRRSKGRGKGARSGQMKRPLAATVLQSAKGPEGEAVLPPKGLNMSLDEVIKKGSKRTPQIRLAVAKERRPRGKASAAPLIRRTLQQAIRAQKAKGAAKGALKGAAKGGVKGSGKGGKAAGKVSGKSMKRAPAVPRIRVEPPRPVGLLKRRQVAKPVGSPGPPIKGKGYGGLRPARRFPEDDYIYGRDPDPLRVRPPGPGGRSSWDLPQGRREALRELERQPWDRSSFGNSAGSLQSRWGRWQDEPAPARHAWDGSNYYDSYDRRGSPSSGWGQSGSKGMDKGKGGLVGGSKGSSKGDGRSGMGGYGGWLEERRDSWREERQDSWREEKTSDDWIAYNAPPAKGMTNGETNRFRADARKPSPETQTAAPSRRERANSGDRSFEEPRRSRRPEARLVSATCKIKVKNIPGDLQESDIRAAFTKEAGPVVSVKIIRDTATIEFQKPTDAEEAVRTFDKGELNGHRIEVVLDP